VEERPEKRETCGCKRLRRGPPLKSFRATATIISVKNTAPTCLLLPSPEGTKEVRNNVGVATLSSLFDVRDRLPFRLVLRADAPRGMGSVSILYYPTIRRPFGRHLGPRVGRPRTGGRSPDETDTGCVVVPRLSRGCPRTRAANRGSQSGNEKEKDTVARVTLVGAASLSHTITHAARSKYNDKRIYYV